MSKFNTTLKSKPDTENLAGGSAYSKSPKLEIASILLNSMCGDTYYEKEESFYDRLSNAYLELKDKKFLAQAAIFARDEFGMRSISHFAANIILEDLKYNKYNWARSFFNKIVVRPDDMSEIIACYWRNEKRYLPNSLKKGFAAAFNRFDNYQISKYRMQDKAISLVDIVNLVHPKPTEKNSDALKQLINNELKAKDTFSAELASAGRSASSAEEKAQSKAEVWDKFVAKEDKVEMFALLRNLRNIKEQASKETYQKALSLLVNEKRIKKSRILPFRFLTAYEELKNCEDAKVAISDAMDICLSNVPRFEGRTLIALDHSGSMFDGWGRSMSKDQPFTLGSVFAAALYKCANTDLCLFNTQADLVKRFNRRDTIMSIVNGLHDMARGGGTSTASIFEMLGSEKYDRIIIISDEQSWYHETRPAYLKYKRRSGADPMIYSMDLRGHATLQFPETNCCCMAGISDKIFDVMKTAETDKQALIHRIESIEI